MRSFCSDSQERCAFHSIPLVLLSPHGRRWFMFCSKANMGPAVPTVFSYLAAVLLEILLSFTPSSHEPNHKISNSDKLQIL